MPGPLLECCRLADVGVCSCMTPEVLAHPAHVLQLSLQLGDLLVLLHLIRQHQQPCMWVAVGIVG